MSTDPKAWRRSVMSDEEAWNIYQKAVIGPAGTLLDEFVRRLGEMRKVAVHSGTHDGDDFTHSKNARCMAAHRPAVLFVQREPGKSAIIPCGASGCCRPAGHSDTHCFCRPATPKVTPENCPCRQDQRGAAQNCCREAEHWAGCCVCNGGKDKSCLKCGRQPKPKPLTDAEKIAKAMNLHAKHSAGGFYWCDIYAILRGESR